RRRRLRRTIGGLTNLRDGLLGVVGVPVVTVVVVIVALVMAVPGTVPVGIAQAAAHAHRQDGEYGRENEGLPPRFSLGHEPLAPSGQASDIAFVDPLPLR